LCVKLATRTRTTRPRKRIRKIKEGTADDDSVFVCERRRINSFLESTQRQTKARIEEDGKSNEDEAKNSVLYQDTSKKEEKKRDKDSCM
jgi:hypothetical protein